MSLFQWHVHLRGYIKPLLVSEHMHTLAMCTHPCCLMGAAVNQKQKALQKHLLGIKAEHACIGTSAFC